jgi:CheY-like chemotaxis protein
MALRPHRAADTLAALLCGADHDVRFVRSGQEAVRQARTFRPDVALLDLSMPGLDGYRVARTLREEHADLRLIALARRGQPGSGADETGFDGQLVKPVDPESLRRAPG